MQENNFEDRVKQVMQGFSMNPSENVWQEIQGQVTQTKNSRRRYVIFGSLLVCLLASSLWLGDMRIRHTAVNSQSLLSENKKENKIIESELSKKVERKEKLETGDTKADNRPDKKFQLNGFANQQNDQQGERKIIHHSVKKNVADKRVEAISVTENEKDELTMLVPDDIKKKENELPYKKDDVAINTAPAKVIDKKIAKEEKNEAGVKAKNNTKDKKNPWSFSFNAGVGRSFTGSHYLNIANYEDYNYSGAVTSPGNGTGNSTAANLPSQTRPGLSIKAGFEIARALSKKTNISTGLYYQLMNTSNATGARVETQSFPNSSRNKALFKTGNSNKYNNLYHFISLPILFSAKLASIKDHDITLGGGIVLSRLIHANALQFDYSQNSYYIDNAVFNKMLTGISVTSMINLSGKSKLPLYIGTEYYYSFTKQASAGIYTNAHYQYFGVTLKGMLQKK